MERDFTDARRCLVLKSQSVFPLETLGVQSCSLLPGTMTKIFPVDSSGATLDLYPRG